MAKIAEVYVEKAVYHVDKAYTYLVPTQMDTLTRGCRVVVPFGRGNDTRQGMVVRVYEDTPSIQLKSILVQLDQQAIFNEEAFGIAQFLVHNTFCTFYDAVKTMLPSAYGVRINEQFSCPVHPSKLDEYDGAIYGLLMTLQQPMSKVELQTYCKSHGILASALQQLTEQGMMTSTTSAKRKRGDDTVKMVRLAASSYPLTLTKKQQEVYDFLTDAGCATVQELCYYCMVGDGVIKTLTKKQVVEYFDREVIGFTAQITDERSIDTLILTPAQQQVVDGIAKQHEMANVSLLHGVTGSGKTAVFMHLIHRTLQAGKQALLLVPEIALTPQITSKFLSYFGQQVAVIHSGLSAGERLDAYKRIKAGDASIVIGTRSAVFAPLSNIGLMILDEEGESSYKSDSAPRYHAREVAKLRAVTHKATLVLASATPAIESYYKAEKGNYHLFELSERYGDAMLPEVYIIDMAREQQDGHMSSISRMLGQEIQKNLTRKEQTILFINRRGYRTVATCLACGEVLKCPDCDVPLVYHKDNGYMMCHHCSHAIPLATACPSCHSPHLKLSGIGTQRIEDELQTMFPSARILRMDTDTTSTKHAYTEKFHAFGKGEYDIMIGTQMVAKGLDFERVTLVGVLEADSGLYANDYRGVERVFSLITQVVGRGGRAGMRGRAYLQSFMPDHPIINLAARQDYRGFYQDEITARQVLQYPPFCDVCLLKLSGVQQERVEQAVDRVLCLLKTQAERTPEGLAMQVYDPIQPTLGRLQGKFRRQILLKCHANRAFKLYLKQVLLTAGKDSALRGVSMYADLNGDCR